MKEFLEPRLDVLVFNAEDVITTSGDVIPGETAGNGVELPDIPL